MKPGDLVTLSDEDDTVFLTLMDTPQWRYTSYPAGVRAIVLDVEGTTVDGGAALVKVAIVGGEIGYVWDYNCSKLS